MARINYVHLAGGGVAAGFVINLTGAIVWEPILARDYARVVGEALPARAIPASMISLLLIGAVSVAIYVFLKTRRMRWPTTAALAGFLTWLVCLALPNYLLWSFEIFDGSLLVKSSAFGAAELIAGSLAGAWVFNRGEATATARAGRETIRRTPRSTPRFTPGATLQVET